MHRNRVALILIVTLLAATPGAASPLDRLWARLAVLWGQTAALDAGCGWDPSGVLRCDPAGLAKVGCGWDPNGGIRCISPAGLDAGCGWDPNGVFHCEPASLDEGIGWDPNGRSMPAAQP